MEEVSGWADSIAKILGSNKPKNKKTLILSRAKLDHEIKVPKDKEVKVKRKRPPVKTEFEIVGKTELDVESPKKAKVEEKEPEKVLSIKQERKQELQSKKERKAWENINRIRPTRTDPRDKEMELVKIATKGVVQLFNAVSIQQKTTRNILKEAHSSEFKKDKVLKKTKEIFEEAMEKSQKLSIEKNKVTNNQEGVVEIKDEDEDDEGMVEIKDEDEEAKVEVKLNVTSTKNVSVNGSELGLGRSTRSSGSGNTSTKKPSWQAFQDDYMLDAKLKDWDQSSDSDE